MHNFIKSMGRQSNSQDSKGDSKNYIIFFAVFSSTVSSLDRKFGKVWDRYLCLFLSSTEKTSEVILSKLSLMSFTSRFEKQLEIVQEVHRYTNVWVTWDSQVCLKARRSLSNSLQLLIVLSLALHSLSLALSQRPLDFLKLMQIEVLVNLRSSLHPVSFRSPLFLSCFLMFRGKPSPRFVYRNDLCVNSALLVDCFFLQESSKSSAVTKDLFKLQNVNRF